MSNALRILLVEYDMDLLKMVERYLSSGDSQLTLLATLRSAGAI